MPEAVRLRAVRARALEELVFVLVCSSRSPAWNRAKLEAPMPRVPTRYMGIYKQAVDVEVE